MTAEIGQFAQRLGFTRRAFVPFVGVVQGAGHQGDGVVRGECFQVDQAHRNGDGGGLMVTLSVLEALAVAGLGSQIVWYARTA